MKKADIIKKLSAFPYDKSEYLISTGAAMVMLGIREETHDIDLGCSHKLFEALEKEGHDYITYPEGGKKIVYDDDIEMSEYLFRGSAVYIDGFPVADPESIIEMKRLLGREKDFRDIALIEKFLNGERK